MKTGVKNDIFWSEIGSGFGEPGGTLQPRTPRSTLRRYMYIRVQGWFLSSLSSPSFLLIFGIETVKTFVHSPSSLIKTIPDSRPKQSLPPFSDQYSAKPYPLGRYILILLMSPPDIYSGTSWPHIGHIITTLICTAINIDGVACKGKK